MEEVFINKNMEKGNEKENLKVENPKIETEMVLNEIVEVFISGKEVKESSTKILKSPSQSSIKFNSKEFIEEKTSSSISFNQIQKTFEEVEFEIKEKQKLEEKINTKEAGDYKIKEDVFMEKLQNKGISALILKEKREEIALFSAKASLREEREFYANLIGKEDCESIRKIQKSASQSNISFKSKEVSEERSNSIIYIENKLKDKDETEVTYTDKYKIQEKLNTKTFGEVRIEEEKFIERSKSEAEIFKLLRYQRKEEININTKESKQEVKDFQANLIGKEDSESCREIIKSASQSSIKFDSKEFNEENTNSIISIDQRPKNWEELDFEIKDKKQIQEKINTKASEDNKTEKEINLEQLNKEENVELLLKKEIKEKSLLSTKTPIHEKKEFSVNLIGKEGLESIRKIQKSASQSSINYKIKEFIETRSDSIYCINKNPQNWEGFEFKINDKIKLNEKINTKAVGDYKIQKEIILEKLNDEENSCLISKEEIKDKVLLSSKASLLEKKELSANLIFKEEKENIRKIQKSASQINISFKSREINKEENNSVIYLEKELKEKYETEVKSL
ncbi:hypothetical protein ACQ4LE_004046, partial [Meloidogyne hapla]